MERRIGVDQCLDLKRSIVEDEVIEKNGLRLVGEELCFSLNVIERGMVDDGPERCEPFALDAVDTAFFVQGDGRFVSVLYVSPAFVVGEDVLRICGADG